MVISLEIVITRLDIQVMLVVSDLATAMQSSSSCYSWFACIFVCVRACCGTADTVRPTNRSGTALLVVAAWKSASMATSVVATITLHGKVVFSGPWSIFASTVDFVATDHLIVTNCLTSSVMGFPLCLSQWLCTIWDLKTWHGCRPC